MDTPTEGDRDYSPTSEVGLPRSCESFHEDVQNAGEQNNVDSDAKWRLTFEQQNKSLMALINAVAPSKNVALPEFNPDDRAIDASAWLATADMCWAGQPFHGTALMAVLSSCMKGSASACLSQICFAGMTWCDFKRIFSARYEVTETAAAYLMKLQQSKPKQGVNLTSYVAAMMTSLMARCKKLSTEQMVTSFALAHVAQFNERIRRLAFTADNVSRTELMNELKSLKHEHLPLLDHRTETGIEAKRPRITTAVGVSKCYKCGKPGHKAAVCQMGDAPLKRMVFGNKDLSTVVCYRCQQNGHYASNCTAKRNGVEKQVNICRVKNPKGSLSHEGAKYEFNFDSGAESSLISESIVYKFRGKQFQDVVKLIGLGQNSVSSNLQVLSIVRINNIDFEILFHVLPEPWLPCNILIGREILSQRIIAEVSHEAVNFKRESGVNVCTVQERSFDIETIDTDALPEARAALLNLLQKYSEFFVQGTPKTRAKVEPMKIFLKDVNKTVYRRPYRLSQTERCIVQEKVNELLQAGIIRESCSPYASPILLVKKKDGSDRMCVDYRELNENTVPDRYPLPLISVANYF